MTHNTTGQTTQMIQIEVDSWIQWIQDTGFTGSILDQRTTHSIRVATCHGMPNFRHTNYSLSVQGMSHQLLHYLFGSKFFPECHSDRLLFSHVSFAQTTCGPRCELRRLEAQLYEEIPYNPCHVGTIGRFDWRCFTTPSLLAKLALVGVIVELCNCEQAAPYQASSRFDTKVFNFFWITHDENSECHYHPNISKQAQNSCFSNQREETKPVHKSNMHHQDSKVHTVAYSSIKKFHSHHFTHTHTHANKNKQTNKQTKKQRNKETKKQTKDRPTNQPKNRTMHAHSDHKRNKAA